MMVMVMMMVMAMPRWWCNGDGFLTIEVDEVSIFSSKKAWEAASVAWYLDIWTIFCCFGERILLMVARCQQNDSKLCVLLSWEFNPKLKSATTGLHSMLFHVLYLCSRRICICIVQSLAFFLAYGSLHCKEAPAWGWSLKHLHAPTRCAHHCISCVLHTVFVVLSPLYFHFQCIVDLLLPFRTSFIIIWEHLTHLTHVFGWVLCLITIWKEFPIAFKSNTIRVL